MLKGISNSFQKLGLASLLVNDKFGETLRCRLSALSLFIGYTT